VVERLLIDECLSQALIAVAKQKGFQADHVVWQGKSGVQDWNLVPYAIDRDDTLVTNNRGDFPREYMRRTVHDGLIIVVPVVPRAEQISLFEAVLNFLPLLPDTVNKLIEIFSDGEIRVRDWSSADSDPRYVRSPSREP
jgi:predicted nuclease of predicted toxin-antitoxin system